MLRRLINEFLLYFRGWGAIASQVTPPFFFDRCSSYCPNIFYGPLSRKLKARGAYLYFVQRDIFPQLAVDRGLLHEKVLASGNMVIDHHSDETTALRHIDDYESGNVSKKILRVVMSYIDYTNRTVCSK